MDKIKRHLAVKKPIIRACYSQDITPQERRHHLEPNQTNKKNPHDWRGWGRVVAAMKRKAG
jgi:hypothetical protein